MTVALSLPDYSMPFQKAARQVSAMTPAKGTT
jgi:hypothetical protein